MKPIVQRHHNGGRVKAVILDWAGTTVDYGCMGPVAAFLAWIPTEADSSNRVLFKLATIGCSAWTNVN